MAKDTAGMKRDKLAEHRPCIRCGRPGETRRAHYNGLRQHSYGKGRGIKCNDVAVAEFCQHCDDRFSEANYPLWEDGSKSIERSEEFLHWCMLTQIRKQDAS